MSKLQKLKISEEKKMIENTLNNRFKGYLKALFCFSMLQHRVFSCVSFMNIQEKLESEMDSLKILSNRLCRMLRSNKQSNWAKMFPKTGMGFYERARR